MELSGQWRATPARDELRRTFHEPTLDDRDWLPIEVPGPWSANDELATEPNVLLRHQFTMSPPDDQRRRWLLFEGMTQQGDVWLNGSYVGNTDGYFVPHRFEVTHLMGDRSDHRLAVELACPTATKPDERSDLLGALIDPQLSGAAGGNPGGIWQPVRVYETGLWAIRHFRAVCRDANPRRALVSLRCVFDSPASTTVTLRTTIGEYQHEQHHSAAVGENRVEWTVEIDNPDLWWPHELQPDQANLLPLRCDLDVGGEQHDARSCRIGLRKVSMRNWELFINGERMYTRGVVLLPTDPQLRGGPSERLRDDLALIRNSGLTSIRMAAHVGHPEIYRTADELGLLIWQEMPLRGVMARSVRTQAIRQAREMVDLLGHHPSIAIWCAHDEPFRRQPTGTATPPVIGQQRPSWNRAVLDTSVRRVLQRTDGSRPVVLHTAVPPHLPRLDGTTSHLWFGWHDFRPDDLARRIRRLPRMARLVTAFGAATVNPDETMITDAIWPAADWTTVGAAVGARPSSLRHLLAPEDFVDGASWARAGFAAQAHLLRVTVETLRRLKYRPNAGFFAFYWADPGPAGGFGMVTSDGRPKPGLDALSVACQPLLAVADPVPAHCTRHQSLRFDVHLISDLREPLTDGRVVATFRRADGTSQTQSWAGLIEADTVARIGSFDADTGTPGNAQLELFVSGTCGQRPVTSVNRYETTVR